MKTIQFSLTLLLGAALGALGLHSCGSNATPNVPICTSYASDPFGEDAKVFAEAVERYARTHGAVVKPDMNSKGVGGTPARVSYISFETLKAFLYFLELYSTQSGISTADLEIPIYYAMHDEQGSYPGLHTVYIGAAQRVDNDLIPIGRFPVQNPGSGEKNSLNEIIHDTYTKGTSSPILVLGTQKMGNLTLTTPPYMRNQWHLCPPNCPPESSLQQLLEQITGFVDNDIANGRAPIDYLR